jgi:hypothetical protein
MRQKAAALRRQRRRAARPSALAIQLHAQLRLESHEPIAHSLFCDAKSIRGGADLTNTREFNERGNLIRTEMGKSGHAETIQGIRL